MITNNIGLGLKTATKIISIQESNNALSHMRFIQDSATGLLPKAILARSKADLAENSFLELSESALVYYGPALLGENIFRKIYSYNLPKNYKQQIAKSATELLKSNSVNNKKLLPIKAAISISCLVIPLLEFSLNYFKNLLTLKVFKQSDFVDIAKLKNTKKTNNQRDKEVAKSAKKHIKAAAITFAGCIATSLVLFRKRNNKFLQSFSEFILAPGNKLFKNKTLKDFTNKYFSLDFANSNGKLTLSHGQLTSCVLIGGLGYFGAAKDRGKQNFLEVLYRMPLVGFYIICGNEILEKGFKKMLKNSGKYKEILDSNLNVPQIKDIEKLAQKLHQKQGGNLNEIYKKLLKQKIFISAVPFLFGIGVMGFFVAGVSRIFTQYRYDKENSKYAYINKNGVFNAFLKE